MDRQTKNAGAVETAETERDALRDAFAQKAWAGAQSAPLAVDASTRRYYRLHKDGRSAVLMDAPPAAEGAPCPPNADEATRKGLGYNALARLAGPNMNAFIALSGALRAEGLSAPEIFEADPDAGFALIEDLGDTLYSRAISAGAAEAPLYENAIDALSRLHNIEAPSEIIDDSGARHALLDYDAPALTAEADLLIDWFWPRIHGDKAPAAARAAYRAAWADALEAMRPKRAVIVLRDFHADNLLWLEGRSGVARTGVIDFQDALRGHRAYDMVSLLEDARRDVSPALAGAMLERYCLAAAEKGAFDEAGFRAGYAALGAQRNAKILGIFARLADRDGKPHYLKFMPRVWAHFENDLTHPLMANLKAWTDEHFPKDKRPTA